ncbi:YadA-like family protein [Pseudomonas machongensis]
MSVVVPGRVTFGAGWAGASGRASAAVGFSAQATSRMKLEAAISWRVRQRWERLKDMHRSSFAVQVPTISCLRLFQAARKQEASQSLDWKASRR